MGVEGVGDRFWGKVNKTDDCWLWTGCLADTGYGRLTYNTEQWYAHRLSYVLHKGEISEGLVLDHLCRNRACVNPDHLQAVPQSINVLRGLNKAGFEQINRTHCPKGHAYDLANTYYDKRNWRQCRACNRARSRRYAEEKRSRKYE